MSCFRLFASLLALSALATACSVDRASVDDELPPVEAVQTEQSAVAGADPNDRSADDEGGRTELVPARRAPLPPVATTISGPHGPQGTPGDLGLGVVPIVWELTDGLAVHTPEDLVVSGDAVYGRDLSGWIATSDDFVSWVQIPRPESAALADGFRLVGFEVRGDMIVAAVTDDPDAADVPATGGSSAEDDVSVFVVISDDGGESWITVPIDAEPSRQGRFVRSSTVESVATDGATGLVLTVAADPESLVEKSALIRVLADGSTNKVDFERSRVSDLVGLNGEYFVRAFRTSEIDIVRSTDGGETWTEDTIENRLDLARDNRLFRNIEGADLGYSDDGGRTWTQIGGAPGTRSNDIAMLDDTMMTISQSLDRSVPGSLISFRSAEGNWVSEPLGDIVPGAIDASQLYGFRGAYYLQVDGVTLVGHPD